jgi:hypothetical protein
MRSFPLCRNQDTRRPASEHRVHAASASPIPSKPSIGPKRDRTRNIPSLACHISSQSKCPLSIDASTGESQARRLYYRHISQPQRPGRALRALRDATSDVTVSRRPAVVTPARGARGELVGPVRHTTMRAATKPGLEPACAPRPPCCPPVAGRSARAAAPRRALRGRHHRR